MKLEQRVPAQVSSSPLEHGSKLRGPTSKTHGLLNRECDVKIHSLKQHEDYFRQVNLSTGPLAKAPEEGITVQRHSPNSKKRGGQAFTDLDISSDNGNARFLQRRWQQVELNEIPEGKRFKLEAEPEPRFVIMDF
ncbi:hypothetical protein TNCV_2534641 [Trichonephila clavipes]|nr:hypothetical protein TNCV_2534641 [Trichonephila clavipes]